MTALAPSPRPLRRPRLGTPSRRALIAAIECFVAVSAAAGGVFALAGAPGVPATWLDGSPFGSYFVPGLVLLVAVGGSMALAAIALLRRAVHAAELSIAAGAVLLGWLAGEALIIPFSWLQPVYGALGILLVGLAERERRAGAPVPVRTRAAAVAMVALLVGLVVSAAMPRGPVTAAGALTLMVVGLALGAAAGLTLGSRWAMALAPLGYAAGFEVGSLDVAGPTMGGPHLDTAWGIFALVLGRGFHGLVALVPMLLGAALAAGYTRRRAPARGHRVTRALRRTCAALTAVALVLLAVEIARPASVPPILGADGRPVAGSIAELAKVRIGGVDQWLEIRGQSVDNPVLLYIPGGPGQSDLALSRAVLAPLTRDFIVVAWDGRGIGKAYPSYDAGALTTDRVVADAVTVTDYLRRRFRERKIYLLGESGGSVIGLLAAQRHPERYYAWLGSGQMVDLRETDRRIYSDLLAYGRRTGDAALYSKLRGYGPPPYASPWAYAFVMSHYDALEGDYDPPAAYDRRGEQSGVGPFGLMGGEYGLVDKVNALRGLMDTFFVLYPQWQRIDFRRTAERLDVPVYLFTGDHEIAGRRSLALEWYRHLRAPRKRLFSYPDAGHATAFEHADDVRRILERTILPATYDRSR